MNKSRWSGAKYLSVIIGVIILVALVWIKRGVDEPVMGMPRMNPGNCQEVSLNVEIASATQARIMKASKEGALQQATKHESLASPAEVSVPAPAHAVVSPKTVPVTSPASTVNPLLFDDEGVVLERRLGVDFYADAELVAEKKEVVVGGWTKRVRILRTKNKYPLVRVEDVVRKNHAGDREEVRINSEMVADHIVVKLRPGMKESDLAALNAIHGASILRKLRTPGNDMFLVQLAKVDVDSVSNAVSAYQAEVQTVAYAHPDNIVRISATPNDPDYPLLWGMNNTGQAGGLARIEVDGSTLSAESMVYAPLTPTGGVTGVLYDCSYGAMVADFPSGVSGNIALIQRGSADGSAVTFATKAQNAMDAGATAAVIYNNEPGTFFGTLQTSGDWIPVVSVSDTDGAVLLAKGTISATVFHVTIESGGDIDAPEAWDMVTGSKDIIVGVIDTGIDYNHPDLADNIWTNPGETGGDAAGNDKRNNGIDDDGNGFVDDWHGWDFCNDDNDPMDDFFHGTHCAGTIGAVGNNNVGVAGVCWNVSLVPLKFIGAGGTGATSDAIEATYYATEIGVHLTSNSWGGTGFDQGLKDAIADAGIHGILFVAAAGNSADNNDAIPHYPASYNDDNIISVAATDAVDGMATFSCYGANSVDLGAPGVSIYSTYPTYMTDAMAALGFSTDYESISGTSMAAPHVAGACALLMSLSLSISAEDIKMKLLTTADPIPALAGKCVSGGRLNLSRVVSEMSEGVEPYIQYERMQVNDSVGGNADVLINPGETVNLTVVLRNRCALLNTPATGVTAVLETVDPYVTVTDGSSAYGDIDALEEKEGLDPFTIQIASDCPTLRMVTMNLTIMDSGTNTWTDTFELMVCISQHASGFVSLDGMPFGGVTVQYMGLLSGVVVTDATGMYDVVVPAGITTFIAVNGSSAFERTAPATVTLPPDRTDINFAFTTAVVSGVVTLDGAPLADATIAYDGDLMGSVQSASDGHYTISRVCGQPITLSLTALKDDYLETATTTVTLPPSQATVDFSFAAATVTGTVSFDGAPMLGATLTFTGVLTGSVESGTNGDYVISGVFGRPGTLNVSASTGGLMTAPISVVLPPSKENVDFAFAGKTFSGTVTDDTTGFAVAGATVTLRGVFCTTMTATTDSAGYYSMSPIFGKTCLIALNAEIVENDMKRVSSRLFKTAPPGAANCDLILAPVSIPAYTLVPIDVPANIVYGNDLEDISWGNHINNNNQVVGSGYGARASKGWFWESGSASLVIPPLRDDLDYFTDARCINDSGHIVGNVAWIDDAYVSHSRAYVYKDGGYTWLYAYEGSSVWSSASAANNDGSVVGSSSGFGSEFISAVIWDPDGNASILPGGDLGFPLSDGESRVFKPLSVNQYGQVVGYAGVFNGITIGGYRPVMWRNEVAKELSDAAYDLPNIGSAFAINDLGEAVGYFGDRSMFYSWHAFIYRDGGMSDIHDFTAGAGYLGSSALDINNVGDIVGYVNDGHIGISYLLGGDPRQSTEQVSAVVEPASRLDGTERAVLWKNGRLYKLNDLVVNLGDWTLERATSINDAGWITGDAKNAGGLQQAFVLMPISNAMPADISVAPTAVSVQGQYMPGEAVPATLQIANSGEQLLEWTVTHDMGDHANTVTVLKELTTPVFGRTVLGSTCDGDGLWLGYYYAPTGEVCLDKMDMDDGHLIRHLDISAFISFPSDLGWDGTNLWVFEAGFLVGDKVHCVNPLTGELIKTLSVPRGVNDKHVAMCYGDGALWMSVAVFNGNFLEATDRIQKIDPTTGDVLYTLDIPDSALYDDSDQDQELAPLHFENLAYANGYLWLIPDWSVLNYAFPVSGRMLYKLDALTGQFLDRFPLIESETSIRTITYDGEGNFWLGIYDYTAQVNKQYLIEGDVASKKWCHVNPSSGKTLAGQSTDLELIFDPRAAGIGIHSGTISLTSTDPDTPLLNVPVMFTVTGGSPNKPVIISGPIAMPSTVAVGQSVVFTVTASDADGDVLTYAWTFGDGTSGSGETPTHAYTEIGNYTTTLTVSDGTGNSVAASLPISVLGETWHTFGWGFNYNGQIGDGTTANRMIPTAIVNHPTGVKDIAGGSSHGLSVKSDGVVWAWGYNGQGQLGDGTTTNRFTPVQVLNLTDIVAVDAGSNYSLALKSDGTVWAWGSNANGQLGDGTTTSRSSPVQVLNLTDVAVIAAGNYHSLAIKTDGTVWAWGSNMYGRLGDGTTTTRISPVQITTLAGVVDVASGNNHSLAVKSDGSVWAWGDNTYGQLGDDTTTSHYSPVQVLTLSGVVSVAGGGSHSLAVKSDGTVLAWGRNIYGQLGDSTTTSRLTPVDVLGLTDIVLVAVGEEHNLAVKSDGSVWGWGRNSIGQLGDGTIVNRFTPVQISSLSEIFTIAAGYSQGFAIMAEQSDNDSDGISDGDDPDDDNDGMPDEWEITYGFDPLVNEDTGLDPDNDGMSNLDESICGTDPYDVASVLRISDFTLEPSTALSFVTVLGRQYGVEYTDDLTPATWESLTNNVPGTGGTLDVNDPEVIGRRFYRIRVRLAE